MVPLHIATVSVNFSLFLSCVSLPLCPPPDHMQAHASCQRVTSFLYKSKVLCKQLPGKSHGASEKQPAEYVPVCACMQAYLCLVCVLMCMSVHLCMCACMCLCVHCVYVCVCVLALPCACVGGTKRKEGKRRNNKRTSVVTPKQSGTIMELWLLISHCPNKSKGSCGQRDAFLSVKG